MQHIMKHSWLSLNTKIYHTIIMPHNARLRNQLPSTKTPTEIYGQFHVKGPRKRFNVEKWIIFMKCER